MIDFRCNARHKDMTPIVKDTDIQDYAETLLRDYKPKLLQEPGKVNPIHFVESYLEAVVDYQDIYYPENAPAIAGATVFNDDRILVFDREAKRIKPIEVAANTVLIDNSTMDDGKAAANVQMKRLGLLVSEETYLEQHRQMAVAF